MLLAQHSRYKIRDRSVRWQLPIFRLTTFCSPFPKLTSSGRKTKAKKRGTIQGMIRRNFGKAIPDTLQWFRLHHCGGTSKCSWSVVLAIGRVRVLGTGLRLCMPHVSRRKKKPGCLDCKVTDNFSGAIVGTIVGRSTTPKPSNPDFFGVCENH